MCCIVSNDSHCVVLCIMYIVVVLVIVVGGVWCVVCGVVCVCVCVLCMYVCVLCVLDCFAPSPKSDLYQLRPPLAQPSQQAG